MKVERISDFIKGWFIGDFEPSMLKTNLFEVAVKEYKAGEKESKHVHNEAIEFTMVLDGVIIMNGVKYHRDDIILIDKGEPTEFESITDSRTLVVKTPSVKGDKHIVQ